MNLCGITFGDVREKSVRVISIKNRIKYFLKSYITKNVVIDERTRRLMDVNQRNHQVPMRICDRVQQFISYICDKLKINIVTRCQINSGMQAGDWSRYSN